MFAQALGHHGRLRAHPAHGTPTRHQHRQAAPTRQLRAVNQSHQRRQRGPGLVRQLALVNGHAAAQNDNGAGRMFALEQGRQCGLAQGRPRSLLNPLHQPLRDSRRHKQIEHKQTDQRDQRPGTGSPRSHQHQQRTESGQGQQPIGRHNEQPDELLDPVGARPVQADHQRCASRT